MLGGRRYAEIDRDADRGPKTKRGETEREDRDMSKRTRIALLFVFALGAGFAVRGGDAAPARGAAPAQIDLPPPLVVGPAEDGVERDPATAADARDGKTAPSAPAQDDIELPHEAYVAGRLLVGFRPGVPEEEKALLHEANGAQVIRSLPELDVHVLRFESEDALAMVQVYQDEDEVAFAEPDYIATIAGAPDAGAPVLSEPPAGQAPERDGVLGLLRTPNDPLFSSQWHHQKLEMEAAWDHASGEGVTVAVVDTGVTCSHPDLSAMCVAGYDFVNGDSDPRDDHGHGTHVAGIAAATTNNGVGVAASGWGAKIMPVKALDRTGNGAHSAISAGISWAADNGAEVINLSLGSFFTSNTLQRAIARAIDSGSVVVAAVGNEQTSNPTYPACYPGVIGISATGQTDRRASFSNYGACVDVAAPGVGILSTVPSGGYQAWSGTSMACPVAAGVIALLVGQDPSRSPAQIEQILEESADDIGDPGVDSFFGHGRINARAAAQHSPGTVTPGPTETAVSSEPTATATPSGDFVQQLEDLINLERNKYGLPPLHTSTALRQASARHSRDMAENSFCGHDGTDGSTAYDRMRDAGYADPYSEIVLCGAVTPAAAVAGWMNSAPHRAIILCALCTELGGGYFEIQRGARHFWTVDFGRTTNLSATPTLALPGPPQATATPGPTQTPPPPTPTQASPTGSETLVIVPDNNRVGWVVSSQPSLNHYDDEETYTGVWNGRIYHGAMQFDLDDIPLGATVNWARLELTGRSRDFLGTTGTWSVNLLRDEIDASFPNEGYTGVHNAAIDATLLPLMGVGDLDEARVNVFVFDDTQLTILGDRRAGTQRLTLRLDGPTTGSFSNLFTWDTGYGETTRYPGPKLIVNISDGEQPPLPTRTPTPTSAATEPPTPSATPLKPDTPPPPTPTATFTAPPPPPSATPTATIPAPIPGDLELVPACEDVGYVRQFEAGNRFCTDNNPTGSIVAGYYQLRRYNGGVQFDLSAIPPGSTIQAAQLVLSGNDLRYLSESGNGIWDVKLLSAGIDNGWRAVNYDSLRAAPISSALEPDLRQYDFGVGVDNVFSFAPIQLAELQFRLETTKRISFRIDGPTGGLSNVMSWDSGYGPGTRVAPRLVIRYGPPGSGEPEPTEPPESLDKILELVDAINAVRELHGVAPVRVDPRLAEAAKVHNQDMSRNGFFSHVGSDGSTPSDRVARTGYQASKVGETLAALNSDPETIVNAWYGQGQRDTLLDPDWTELGAHYVHAPWSLYNHYWVAVFARPASGP